ncbi:unnamed protein product [Caenorhabditis angaria]|uniref:Uncharacterized protein n=1 Tax=Caenorhabditis angaria TaxID=860376 RepID=A0A9P1IJJ7_9PELO|nr:unnamed protein product [Caenorhabditis angaria]
MDDDKFKSVLKDSFEAFTYNSATKVGYLRVTTHFEAEKLRHHGTNAKTNQSCSSCGTFFEEIPGLYSSRIVALSRRSECEIIILRKGKPRSRSQRFGNIACIGGKFMKSRECAQKLREEGVMKIDNVEYIIAGRSEYTIVARPIPKALIEKRAAEMFMKKFQDCVNLESCSYHGDEAITMYYYEKDVRDRDLNLFESSRIIIRDIWMPILAIVGPTTSYKRSGFEDLSNEHKEKCMNFQLVLSPPECFESFHYKSIEQLEQKKHAKINAAVSSFRIARSEQMKDLEVMKIKYEEESIRKKKK